MSLILSSKIFPGLDDFCNSHYFSLRLLKGLETANWISGVLFNFWTEDLIPDQLDHE